MPSFFKDLNIRRRSKASFKTATTNGSSENTSSNDNASDDHPPPNKSSSTLNSLFDQQSPPTTLSSLKSRSSSHLPKATNGAKTPPLPGHRPRLPSAQSNRYSLVGMPPQNGEAVPRPAPATSPLAPRVLSVSDGSWVSVICARPFPPPLPTRPPGGCGAMFNRSRACLH